MKNIKDICFIVQARTQSTRVSNKMLRPFAHSNLFTITIKKILQSKVIPKNNFYLSIMDEELVDIAKKNNINYFIRSEESTQEPVTLPKVFEWYNKLPYKYFVIINACNPILTIETIDKFTTQFLESNSRGQFGVFEKKTFLFNNDGVMINKFFGDDKYLATLETKFVETCYEAAHSLYAGTMEDIGKEIYMGSFKKPKDPEFFVMDEIECFDIDWPWQFKIAEKLYLNE
tara:strand:- start:1312 stop:2001 length:690 start_codon:yes stop_codon:yes gene_type:complete